MIGKEVQLPLVAVLPLADPAMMTDARDIVAISQGLLLSQDSPLLAVSLAAAAPGRIILWNQRLEPCSDRVSRLCGTPFCSPALVALRSAANALADRLAQWGWTGAAHPHLHAVTDGTGLVLTIAAADDPYREWNCGWLLGLARPAGDAVMILPMAEDGIWELLTAENAIVH